jgi:hypothetical protein
VTEVKRKPPRVIRLVRPPDEHGVGVFAVTLKKATQFYVFKEIPSEIGGRGFVVHRLGLADVYHVRIGAPVECSCECLGFLRHSKCKHIQGLSALIGHGMLPPQAPP